MWENNPYCYWCGRKTHFLTRYVRHPSGNVATVDHLYPNSDARRKRCKRNRIPSPVVLSCYKCNHQRRNVPFEDYCKKMKKDLDLRFIYY